MGTVFRNAMLVQLDPVRIESGALRQSDGRIDAVGSGVVGRPDDETVDCAGAVLMPGLVNGHTHLYSALAVGMPPPPKAPGNFHEILRYIWWRLDRAHDLESVECSGRVGALAALRCGTTTLIDHHASPEAVEGSLDALQSGIATVGCRGVLCYETTDRNRAGEGQAGLEENERYIRRCRAEGNEQFAGMVGAHASFTLGERSLAACVDRARRLETGIHIHVAEDPVDESITRQEYGCGLWERLERHGLLEVPGTVLAHGTHLSPEAVAAANERDEILTVAHNPNSNMNNGVGYAPAARFDRLMLGTDGIGADMWREGRAALFKSHDAGRALALPRLLPVLNESARCASGCLGVRLGCLDVGAAADLVVTRYVPATALTCDNLAGHLVYAMGAEFVRHVMVAGRWALREGQVVSCDPTELRRQGVEVANALWGRMAALGGN